jgi:hypothetical protein
MNPIRADEKTPIPSPIEGLMERYYKKKYFSMNIFKIVIDKTF